MTDALGWRKKFAVLAPSTNTIVEPDFYAMRVPGVTAHFSRIHIRNQDLSSDAAFQNLLAQIREEINYAIDRVMTCEPDYVVMGMSAETFWDGVEGNRAFKRRVSERAGGLGIGLVLALGIVILLRNIGLYELDFSVFWKLLWPLLIILIGWSLLRSASTAGGTHWAVMSGIESKNPGWELRSSGYVAIMGGIEMDLRVANIPEGRTVLDLTAVMGGIDLRVPGDLDVECEGTAILGGVRFFQEGCGGVIASRRFQRRVAPGQASAKKLLVRCRALMGGIEIK